MSPDSEHCDSTESSASDSPSIQFNRLDDLAVLDVLVFLPVSTPSWMSGSAMDPSEDNLLTDEQYEQLSAYVDGELSPPEVQAVEAWLAVDPVARQIYSQLRSIQAGFDRLPAPTTRTDDVEQIVDAVMHRMDAPWWSRVPQQPMVTPLFKARSAVVQKVAAALVLLLGSGLSTWQWTRPDLIISIEEPPVRVAGLTPATAAAGQYLLQPADTQDPYDILFSNEEPTDPSL